MGANDDAARAAAGASLAGVEPGKPLGKSWIFVARVIPVDFDDLCLAEIGPGRRFLERSRMGSASLWQHEREVVETGTSSCEVSDRVAIELRAPLRTIGGERIAPRIMRALFEHRHNRLAEWWGVAGSGT